MLYEVREYAAVPGKMRALVARFRDHTLELFKRHGLDVVFITLTEVGDNSNNELVYVLRFDSYEQLQSKWAAFQADPEWQQARAASEVDGPLVARIRRRILNDASFAAR